jgi:tRNA modification GTPase
MLFSSTIVALATPAGGALGILRLSGTDTFTIVNKIFTPVSRNVRKIGEEPNRLYYGELHDLQGNIIDDVVLSVYCAPHSYTGEDCAEFSCHGSAYIMQQALHACIDAGARQANHGEYTRRAYLNGKMDLSQAEAVADLIASTNRATHDLALSQLKGHFSNELTALREQLLKLTSLLELELDFSDHEELEFADRTELTELSQKISSRIATLAHSFETGNAIKRGIPVAIIGRTNVGKSTLLNQLLHEEKAIVSDIDGTTRDVIEDTININGITFRFIDTAGIRETQDAIEKIGIERALKKLDEASIVLWLLDSQPTEQAVSDMMARCQDKSLIPVINKIDLNPAHADNDITNKSDTSCKEGATAPYFPLSKELRALHPLCISAKSGLGIKELEDRIYKVADIPEISENSVIITSARHYEALTRAEQSITHVLDGLTHDLSADLLAEDLRLCLDQLADITGGQITPQETLNNIFQHFCIGK